MILDNKYSVKMSFHTRKVLLHFLQFEGLSLLLNILGMHFDIQLSTERNIVDIFGALKSVSDKSKLPTLEKITR